MSTIGYVEPISPPHLDRNRRQFAASSKVDQRSEAQRDRDRILYASAFRRLGGVTQVVLAMDEGHVFHNRLTHSVKVAHVARRLAEKLLFESQGRPGVIAEIERSGGLDPDVVEAAGLAHDLGHPPFGHVGEQELDDLVQQWDSDGFEGNAQTFRIVTRLAHSGGGAYPGLNLTRATLAAVQKYPWPRPRKLRPHGPKPPKFGFYGEDADLQSFALQEVAPSLHHRERTLEAQIMDWADDISYAVHDLEDFYRAHWTPIDRLSGSFNQDPIRGVGYIVPNEEMKAVFAGVRKSWYGRDGSAPSDSELLDAAKLPIIEFPITHPFTGSTDDRQRLRTWTSILIGTFIQETSLGPKGLVRPRFIKVQIALLKQLTREYVLSNPMLSTHQYGQRMILRRLFDTLMSESQDGNLSVFPVSVRVEARALSSDKERARFIADTISRMTDLAVVHLHGRLTGVDLGPLEDPAVN